MLPGGQPTMRSSRSLGADRLIGADVIRRAEDREVPGDRAAGGYLMPASEVIRAPEELDQELAFPVIVRPAFTLGGHGGGVASTRRSSTANSSSACGRARSARCSSRSR